MRESRAVRTNDVDDFVPPIEHPDLVEEIREGFLSAPWEDVVQRHLAAMLVTSEAAWHLAEHADRSRRRRVAVFLTTAAMGASLLAGGAAAASGSLPAPAQRAVAGIVEPFGVDLPTGRQEDAPGQEVPPPDSSDPVPESDGGGTAPTPSAPTSDSSRSDAAPGHGDATNNAPTTTPGHEPSGGRTPLVPPGLEDGTGPPPHGGAPSSPPGQDVNDAANKDHGPPSSRPKADKADPG